MSVRIMNTPEDYKKLGVSPDKVEMWEDGRRDNDDSGHWEWWYSDAIMDDGTTVVIQFLQKSIMNVANNVANPAVSFRVTLPDGTKYEKAIVVPNEQCTYSTEKCDVRFGPHIFSGDLKEYKLYVETVDGMGADLTLTSLSKPFRPGTAYFGFDDLYYTWLCVVPKGKITGTLTINGKKVQVNGYGYHDHQWGSIPFHFAWNHWWWARQSYEDYTLLVFNMVASRNHEFKSFPIMFIQDKEGELVFSNTEGGTCEILEEYQCEVSGKDYPKITRFTCNNSGKDIEYTLTANKELETVDSYHAAPEAIRATIFDKMGLRPSYTRYLASGDLVIKDGNETIERSAELIYEFMYPGKSYKDE